MAPCVPGSKHSLFPGPVLGHGALMVPPEAFQVRNLFSAGRTEATMGFPRVDGGSSTRRNTLPLLGGAGRGTTAP